MTFESVYEFIKSILFIRFDSAAEIIRAIAEMSLFSYLIYKIMVLVKETRAWQLLKGIILIFAITLLSNVLELKTLSFILNNTLSLMTIGVVIIFQPELRRGLEQIGRSTLKDLFGGDGGNVQTAATIDSITRAAGELAKTYTGAIIVIEKETKVGDLIGTGITINADVSAELLINVFTPNSPLHDGAVIIRGNRLTAATCYLPLTDSQEISKALGTRHRAAIGVTEVSDALCIVVSEETGKISIARNGSLTRDVTIDRLKQALTSKLLDSDTAARNTNVRRMPFLKGKSKNE